METHSNEDAQARGIERGKVARSRTQWAFIGFAIVAGFFLVTEHRAHLFGILPYLFLLACPLMHLFHHGGHGHHHRDATPDKSKGEGK